MPPPYTLKGKASAALENGKTGHTLTAALFCGRDVLRRLRYALGMEIEYKHGGHTTKVVAIQKLQEPCVWESAIYIDGNRVPLGLFSTHYPAKHHPSESDAFAYGKKAAEFVVDHPAGSTKTLDEMLNGL